MNISLVMRMAVAAVFYNESLHMRSWEDRKDLTDIAILVSRGEDWDPEWKKKAIYKLSGMDTEVLESIQAELEVIDPDNLVGLTEFEE